MKTRSSILRSSFRLLLPTWKYISITAILTLLSFVFLIYHNNLSGISLGDAFANLSLGMRPVPKFNPQYIFRIPLLWISLYSYLFFSVNALLRLRPSSYSYTTLFNLQKRTSYWLMTYLTAIVHIAIHFLTMLLILLFCVLAINGEVTFALTPGFIHSFLNGFNTDLTTGMVFVSACLLPFMASTAIAVLEVSLMLFIGAPQSFLLVVCILVISAFFDSSLTLGNYLMFLRNETLASMGNSNIIFGLVILFSYMLLSYIAGMIKIRKSNII